MKRFVQTCKNRIHIFRMKFVRAFEGGEAEAFSPTMLQVQNAPPAPLARTIAVSIAAFLLAFLIWSIWADFDVVVSASGSAMPSAKTKVVQSLDAGRVTAIHVKDGDAVEQGTPVVELDATVAGADREKTEQDALEAQLDVLRLKAQLAGQMTLGPIPETASAELVGRQKHLLISRSAEQQQKMAVLEQEVSRKRAELGSTTANIKKIEATLPMLQQRLDMREKLLKDGFVAELTVLESRLEVANQLSELTVQKEKLKESESALKASELAKLQAQAEYVSRTSAEMTDAKRRWLSGQQEFVKAAYKEAYQVLVSPIAGTVQQLAVHTLGGVVNPGQALMTVVPKEGGIEVEAQVLNRDVGFLKVGMPVTVKLDAFEFTKYGALEGVVQWIGADAVKDEKMGMYYPVRVLLQTTHLPIAVNGQHPEIRIGMTVTADIAIGQRKAYEYFLGPLLKYKNESLRER
ncbi:HlyD family type I secretion periplasmic adaptor subunit [Limnohabitans sp.]|uniref:HlyD family type I secretion periplasmic adaptor subunit n=1 Tax=Limnohabitans sp. TaxID=1907725 RepID=UPI0035B31953